MITTINTLRKSVFAIASGLILLSAASSASAAGYPAYLEDDLIAVCQAIHANEPRALKNAVRNSGVSLKALIKGLRCNGDDMMTFAERHKSFEAGELLARRLKISEGTFAARARR